MRHEFTLPDLGEGLGEAEIVNWLVAVGDVVAEDQAIVEVETAKAVSEIPSPVAGKVAGLGGGPGDVLAVGSVLISFDTGQDRTIPEPGGQDGTTPKPGGGPAAAGARGSGRVLAAPSTRKLAVSLGVDLALVPGTGPAGRITRADVERAAGPQAAPAARRDEDVPLQGDAEGDEEVPLRGVRREIARTMTRSWREIPHITEFRELDATRLVEVRDALRERAPEGAARLTFLPFLVMACAAALRRHRVINARFDTERELVTYRGSIDIGIATSSNEGLVVPILRGADRLGLFEIGDRAAELAVAVRARHIRPGQLAGGTFTISNFGSYGTWLGTPIINPPQVAIAGFGRIRDAVVAAGGRPVVRPTLPVAVSADHRIVDGDVLGAFVGELAALLENPVLLIGEAR